MSTLAAQSKWQYSGGDISQLVVNEVLSKHPKSTIGRFDVCKEAFPQADVWHCRDCLFHLPYADIRDALDNVIRSDIPYALLTTHKARFLHRNLDVGIGGFRYLDLERAPMNLPRPIDYLRDYNKGSDFPGYVGLWHKESIVEALEDWSV